MLLDDVPRIDAHAFRTSWLSRVPRVVVGISRTWKAARVWAPQYLKDVAGETIVDVRERKGAPRNFYQNLAQGGSVRFADYLDWVLEIAEAEDIQSIGADFGDVSDLVSQVCGINFEKSYYLDIDLASLSHKLLADVKAPGWYKREPIKILFWCGILGTSSGLHADVTPNCNVQVIGRKHFVLYDPSQTSLLYREPRTTHCRFDPNLPDFERYPLARRARGVRCTLEPGEALYIPVGWYHQVTVLSSWAVNVNFFWPRPFPQGLMVPPLWQVLLRRFWARLHIRGQKALASASAPTQSEDSQAT